MPVEIIGCGMVCDGGVGNGLMYFLFLSVILPFRFTFDSIFSVQVYCNNIS